MQRFVTQRFRNAFTKARAHTPFQGGFNSFSTGTGLKAGPVLQKPAVAYGAHQMDKEDFSNSLLSMLRDGGFTKEQLAKVDNVVMNKMDIDKRYFVQRPEDTWALNMQEKTDVYCDKAVELLDQAAQEALANGGIDGSDIDCIITTSGLNLVYPQAPVQLAHRKPELGFKSDVVHKIFPAVTCCGGGGTTTREAIDYLTAHPTHNVLMMNIELSSLMWDSSKMDPIDIFTRYALFGDAVTSAVVFGAESKKRKPEGLELLGGRQFTVPDSCDAMYYTYSDRGPSLQITKKVPILARAGEPGFARGLSQDYFGVEPKDLPWSIIHPGGKKILTEVAEELDLLGSDSHKLMKEHYRLCGNLQSASVMDMMRMGWPKFKKDQDMILVAIGAWVLEGIAMRARF